MKKPIVFVDTGIIAYYGSSVDAAVHQHYAIQVVVKDKLSSCKLNEVSVDDVTVINSMCKHQLQLETGWLLLIEPRTQLGWQLQKLLASELFITRTLSVSHSVDTVEQVIAVLALTFNLSNGLTTPLVNETGYVKDKRIQKALDELNNAFANSQHEMLDWRAKNVAQRLALSDSRFLHLFSAQVGLPWRPYLMWQRVLFAIKSIKSGQSATDAAQLAGFSDSAHLSRTFRRHFGLSIRQALSLLKHN